MICNQQKYRVVGIMMLLVLMFSLIAPVSIYADPGDFSDVEVVVGAGNIKGYLGEAIENANKKLGYDSDKVSSPDNTLYVDIKGVPTALLKTDGEGKVEIDMETWKASSDTDNAMKEFVDALDKTDASDDAVQDFMTTFQDTDNSVSSVMLPMIFRGTKANLYRAYQILKPAIDALNVVLGFGCVGLILLLLASTVFDLAYIGLPMFREMTADKKGGLQHFGISFEALKTVEDIEKGSGDGNYRNGYLLYFKRRALTYIVLAICIMYLICGGLSGIISWVLGLTTGLF